MAIHHEQQGIQEIRESAGRSDVVANQQDIQVAGILREDNARIIEFLGDLYTPIPWETCNRTEDYFLPDDIEFKFLDKDLTKHIKKAWNGVGDPNPMPMHRRFKRALGVYDWVIANRPKVIVVWTDEYPECRAAIMAGRDLRIPTVELVHGGFHPYMHGNFSVKSFAEWKLGSWEYRDWHKFHKREGTAIPTGITFMDPWVRTNMSTGRGIARKTLRIENHVPVVCYIDDAAFERGPWNEQAYVDYVRETFISNFKILTTIIPDIQLIVKLHPYDRDMTPQGFQNLLVKYDIKHNYSIIDDGLAVALAASDLAVGFRSTAMVFGLLLGLPSMPLDVRPFFEGWAYRGFGFEPVSDVSELLSKMTHVLTDSSRMSELIGETKKGALWFGTDGLASLRAERAIRLLLDGKEPDEQCYSNPPQ